MTLMHGPDPNWYYSSLAQSSASIVGLFGAILATRLQASLERAAEQQVRVNQALRQLEGLARPMLGRFSVYAENSPSQIERIRSALEHGSSSLTEPLWFHPYDSAPSTNAQVGVDPHTLEVEAARTELALAALPHLQTLLAAAERGALERFGPAVEPYLNDTAEGMSPPLRDVSALAQAAAAQLAVLSVRTRTRMHRALLWCLAILSVGGLIAPLCFLTAYDRSHKILLTGALAVGLGVLLWYIRLQIKRLREFGTYDSLMPPGPRADAAI
jgi:hypothetical protein